MSTSRFHVALIKQIKKVSLIHLKPFNIGDKREFRHTVEPALRPPCQNGNLVLKTALFLPEPTLSQQRLSLLWF